MDPEPVDCDEIILGRRRRRRRRKCNCDIGSNHSSVLSDTIDLGETHGKKSTKIPSALD